MSAADVPAQASALDAWRVARAAALALRDAHELEMATIAATTRAAYAAVCAPAQRARLVPAPSAPCRFSDLQHAYRSWRDALGKGAKGVAAIAAADADVVSRGLDVRLAAMFDEQRAAGEAEREAASRVPGPVSGEGASWHLVRSVSIHAYGTQGLGAASYARTSATLRARDLIELGYRVRCIARRRPASLPVGPYYLGPIWAWDVYVWTCSEGERIAPHQSPPRSIADDLRRARDEGVNPAALWSCVPHRLVEAAGADRVSDRGPPPPLAWETLDASEPLPPLAGDANLLDAPASPA